MTYDEFGYPRKVGKETVEWVEREQKVILPLKDQEAALKAGREARKRLIEHLREAMKDESSAESLYLKLANEAMDAGYPEIAANLRDIAKDEFKHRGYLDGALLRLAGR